MRVFPPAAACLLRPTAWWAVLHVPLLLFFYAPEVREALSSSGVATRPAVAISLVAQACFVALLMFLATLPWALFGRAYAVLAPLLVAVLVAASFLDSLIFEATRFHLNGLALRLTLQPGVLHELGVSPVQLAAGAALVLGALVADAAVGWRFVSRRASPRAPWKLVACLLALSLADRLAVGVLTWAVGEQFQAVGGTLPLQVPLRMNRALSRLAGRPGDAPLSLAPPPPRPPRGLDPASVHFTRTPDVVVLLAESLPADFFEAETMPLLFDRAKTGRRCERHYAAASSTHYSLFSLFYGLDAHQLEAVVGRGQSPLLFGALQANGYDLRLFTASSVSWMGLRDTVFRDVGPQLDTDFEGEGGERDDELVRRATRFVEGAGPRPFFLFLFFDGTHYPYSVPAGAERFTPQWEPAQGLGLDAPPLLLRNRARNAAHEVDRKMAGLLELIERRRGRPLVVFTADHGEEFRQKGHLGHGSDVTDEQVHVPFVLWDEGLAPGRVSQVTGHVDLVPTLIERLGETRAPELFADGRSVLAGRAGRFVLTTVGWEQRFAVIGEDLKVSFLGQGLGGATRLTDPEDRPLPDGPARLERAGVEILRALQR